MRGGWVLIAFSLGTFLMMFFLTETGLKRAEIAGLIR